MGEEALDRQSEGMGGQRSILQTGVQAANTSSTEMKKMEDGKL